jgi:hypothetical protein
MQISKLGILKSFITFFMIIQFLFFCFFSVNSQSNFSFTEKDIFKIPSKNSSVRFATNGTYEVANFENDFWIFKKLDYLGSIGSEKLDIKVSATDCDLTFHPYRINSYSYGKAILKWKIIPYTVSNRGKQIIDLGVDTNGGHLDVILDGEFVGRNQGWTISNDGTVTITGATSNVTLWYIGFPEYLETEDFLSGHSVLIGSTSFFALTLVLAVFVAYRSKGGD